MDTLLLTDLQNRLPTLLGRDHVATALVGGELTLQARRESVVRVLKVLRDDARCRFDCLMDLCGVDYPDRGPDRFEVVYHLLSLVHNLRLRVKVTTDGVIPVPTVTDVFPAAGWFEREAWDLYGITFAGHPDLRRILTDYGFEGHPLRKDFPLWGHVEIRYDSAQQRIVQEPVVLPQPYRSFDFESPWEGMEKVMEAGAAKKAVPLGAELAQAPGRDNS